MSAVNLFLAELLCRRYQAYRRGGLDGIEPYARAGYEKKCIDCHYDLVHNDKEAVMYRQLRKAPYQAKGLRVEKLGT